MPTLADDLRYLIDRDHQTARPLLHDLVARLPNSVEARRLLGESYQRSFDAAHALEHYRAAHLLEPENLLFRERMGLCTAEMGDYEAALAIYRDAISLAPTVCDLSCDHSRLSVATYASRASLIICCQLLLDVYG